MKERLIPNRADWKSLKGVFDDNSLGKYFSILENEFNVTNETEFFARLVNMSTANKEPFHRWIRYREGYAGELVKEILRRYPINPQKHFLMDPMCGSGSSLVAACDLGIDALGLDVNGYAVLSSNVKSRHYKASEIKEIEDSISKLRRVNFAGKSVPSPSSAIDIEKYFPLKNFEELLKINEWIKRNVKPNVPSDFFQLAFLASLEDCSDRKKDGNGLATRPAPVHDPKDRILGQLDLMLEDIKSSRRDEAVHCYSVDLSALELSTAASVMTAETKKSVHSIIFSPPYANSFDYFESYKLELIFGGFVTADDLKKAKSRLIRNFRITKPKSVQKEITSVEKLSAEILKRIPEKEAETGVRDGRTRLVPNMLRGYFEDMNQVMKSGFDSLSSGGMMHIVVDQSAYVGVPIPTDLIFAALAKDIGYEVTGVINCRRANTSGQQLKKFPYLKDLLRESIVSLRKPIC
jgi:DNA modification methylase